MPTLTLDQIVRSVEELPALPEAAQAAVRMAANEESSAREIADILGADVALAARVLRIANSAYYGLQRGIGTLSEAVVIMGLQMVRDLCVAAASCDLLLRPVPGYGLAPGELWRHSIRCAGAARMLARKSRAARSEEAFVAGLLHDIGKVVLNVHVADQYLAIQAIAELEGVPFYTAEKQILGFDHAGVGGRVGEKWNLPITLCAAIEGHHNPNNAGRSPEMASIIHVANILAHATGFGLGADGPRQPADAQAMRRLRLTEADLDETLEALSVADGPSMTGLMAA